MWFFCTFAFSKNIRYEIEKNFSYVHVDIHNGVFF